MRDWEKASSFFDEWFNDKYGASWAKDAWETPEGINKKRLMREAYIGGFIKMLNIIDEKLNKKDEKKEADE